MSHTSGLRSLFVVIAIVVVVVIIIIAIASTTGNSGHDNTNHYGCNHQGNDPPHHRNDIQNERDSTFGLGTFRITS